MVQCVVMRGALHVDIDMMELVPGFSELWFSAGGGAVDVSHAHSTAKHSDGIDMGKVEDSFQFITHGKWAILWPFCRACLIPASSVPSTTIPLPRNRGGAGDDMLSARLAFCVL